jgi:hypothetical protein
LAKLIALLIAFGPPITVSRHFWEEITVGFGERLLIPRANRHTP